MSILSLSTLSPRKGARKKRKRLGRGNASKGTYSGRGLKGQKARSGVSGLKQLGMKNVLRTIPKKRGFTSLQRKATAVSLNVLEMYTTESTVMSPERMVHKGIVTKGESKNIKVVGKGPLAKKLQIRAHAFSEPASEAILEAGGRVILIRK